MSSESKNKKSIGAKFTPLEKPKNLKKALSRLFNELKKFKIFIIASLILAILSSVLSIYAPNKLSDLTDEISKGLVFDTKKIENIQSEITKKIDKEKIKNSIINIIIRFHNGSANFNIIFII